MLFVYFLIINLSVPQESTYKIVNYHARKIIYYPRQEKVILLDSATVKYGELKVIADSIEYDISKKTLSAFKNVYFTTATEIIQGQALFYNITSKKGYMVNAQTKLENGFVYGENAWLVKTKTLHIRNGYYTTCEHNPPHYYFYSPKSKVLIDNTAFAEPVILKIFGTPCAIAPFWFFPVSKQRKSGLLPFKFGQSKSEGRYAKGIAYYLVLNDYSDITFSCDILEKKGIQPKIEFIYLINPLASGQMFLSYIRELDTKRQRYSINAKHRSVFLLNSELNSYIDFQSDESYMPDYPENRAQWLKKELYSQATLSREIKKIGRLGLRVERKDDFRTNVINWKLPGFSFNFHRLPISKNWNLSPGISYLRIKNISYPNNRKRIYHANNWTTRLAIANPNTFLGNFDVPINFSFDLIDDNYTDSLRLQFHKFQAGSGFSLSQVIFYSLSLSQALDYNQTITYRERNSYFDAQLKLNLGASINLYRLFGISLGALNKVLHRMTPQVNINYAPQMKSYRYIFYPRFDTTPNTADIGFSINNLFEGKFKATTERRELLAINARGSYDIRTKNFTPINIEGNFYLLSQPNAKFATNVGFSLPSNISRPRIKDLNINTNFNWEWLKKDTVNLQERGFKISVNHFFSASSEGNLVITNNMLNLVLSIIPRGARFDFSSGINFKEYNKIANYHLTIWKDLHCWEAIIEVNRFGKLWSYDFKVRIKKIPDVSFSKGMLDFILPY